MAIAVGQQAPQFSLYDTNLTEQSLSGFTGQTIVLAFYPGAFTGVCDKEVCQLRDSMSRFNDANAVVIGISVDGPFANKEFVSKNSLNFTLLSDFDRVVTKQYDVLFANLGGVEGYNTSNRAVFIIDSTGTIRYSWEAQPNPGVEPNYDELLEEVIKINNNK